MNKETKGNHPTTSEDSLELRIKELEEELATATHCWGVVSERLDWLEDRMAPENAGKSFVIELCDDYRDRFFEIKEDAIQSPPNRKFCYKVKSVALWAYGFDSRRVHHFKLENRLTSDSLFFTFVLYFFQECTKLLGVELKIFPVFWTKSQVLE